MHVSQTQASQFSHTRCGHGRPSLTRPLTHPYSELSLAAWLLRSRQTKLHLQRRVLRRLDAVPLSAETFSEERAPNGAGGACRPVVQGSASLPAREGRRRERRAFRLQGRSPTEQRSGGATCSATSHLCTRLASPRASRSPASSAGPRQPQGFAQFTNGGEAACAASCAFQRDHEGLAAVAGSLRRPGSAGGSLAVVRSVRGRAPPASLRAFKVSHGAIKQRPATAERPDGRSRPLRLAMYPRTARPPLSFATWTQHCNPAAPSQSALPAPSWFVGLSLLH